MRALQLRARTAFTADVRRSARWTGCRARHLTGCWGAAAAIPTCTPTFPTSPPPRLHAQICAVDKLPYVSLDWVLEGGSIHVDGEG